MTPHARQEAVSLLHKAEVDGSRVSALPQDSKPASIQEALAMQDELVAASGRRVAGWKVATDPNGVVMRGAIYEDDCFQTPARIPHQRYPLMGVEGEIAYRFRADLPRREEPYTDEELRSVLEPFAAIEIVDTRFESYHDTPVIDRLVDRMSNGGFVIGPSQDSSSKRKADQLRVRVTVNGEVSVDQIGGHSRGDPFLPAVELIHSMQRNWDFKAGQFITTGTFTGTPFGRSGQHFAIEFEEFGTLDLFIE